MPRKVRYQLLPLLLFPLGLALYSAALRAPFVYDDRGYIITNETLRTLSNFLDISGTRYVGFLSFALNYRISGLNPFDFHLTNVFIHIINSVLVFFLVMDTSRTPLVRARQEWEGNKPLFIALAFASSVIFLSHPIQTQAVTYITQRFASLATTFYALSVLLYVKARLAAAGDAHKPAGKRFFYAASLVSAVLAMKTKEISFTLPFVIALYDYVFFSKDAQAARMRVPFYLMLLIIPFSMLAPEVGFGEAKGIAGVLRRVELHDAGAVSRYSYMLTQLSVVVTYLRLMVYPSGQRIDYDYPLTHSIFEPKAVSSLILLLLVALAAVYVFYKSRKTSSFHGLLFSFGVFWFFITLSVESSVIPIQDVIFEQRVYLPSIGFVLAAVSAVSYFGGRVRRGTGMGDDKGLCAVIVLVLACPALFIATHMRNLLWTDEIALLNDAISKTPGKARLYYARALVRLDRNELAEALKDSTIAVNLNPKSHNQYNLRGIVYAALGMHRESLKDFDKAIAYDPAIDTSYFNRAITYMALKEYGKAVLDYDAAIFLNPDYAAAYNNRGLAYLAMSKHEKAEADLKTACSMNHAEACNNLSKMRNQ